MAGWPLLLAGNPTLRFVKCQEDFVDPKEESCEPGPVGTQMSKDTLCGAPHPAPGSLAFLASLGRLPFCRSCSRCSCSLAPPSLCSSQLPSRLCPCPLSLSPCLPHFSQVPFAPLHLPRVWSPSLILLLSRVFDACVLSARKDPWEHEAPVRGRARQALQDSLGHGSSVQNSPKL